MLADSVVSIIWLTNCSILDHKLSFKNPSSSRYAQQGGQTVTSLSIELKASIHKNPSLIHKSNHTLTRAKCL